MLIPHIATIILLILSIIGCIFYLKKASKKTFYSYKNMLIIGIIIFLILAAILLISQIPDILEIGLEYYIPETFYFNIAEIFSGISYLVFPIAGIIAGLLILGSIIVIIREGKNLGNLLGIIVGIFVIIAIVIDLNIFTILSWFFDLIPNDLLVSNSREFFRLYLIIGNVVDVILVYFECIIVASFICTIKAGRHRPKTKPDYTIILGCYPGKDINLAPILRGRVEKAMSTSQATTIFVPSGGQGKDEDIPEADAISNYLQNQGIKKSHILIENHSTSTRQNMLYSKELILNHLAKQGIKTTKNTKIFFSTTNYHVFRSGVIAAKSNLKAEGVGSKTKWYFYINASLREFIANIASEWKVHLLNILIINLIAGFMIAFSLTFDIL